MSCGWLRAVLGFKEEKKIQCWKVTAAADGARKAYVQVLLLLRSGRLGSTCDLW